MRNRYKRIIGSRLVITVAAVLPLPRHAGGNEAGGAVHLPGVLHRGRGDHVGQHGGYPGGEGGPGGGRADDLRRSGQPDHPAPRLRRPPGGPGHQVHLLQPHAADPLRHAEQPGPPQDSGDRRPGGLQRRDQPGRRVHQRGGEVRPLEGRRLPHHRRRRPELRGYVRRVLERLLQGAHPPPGAARSGALRPGGRLCAALLRLPHPPGRRQQPAVHRAAGPGGGVRLGFSPPTSCRGTT